MIIKIKNLKLKAILGIYEWEKLQEREVIINLTIETDFDQARYSHDIKDTIDYDDIRNSITQLLTIKNFKLIEEMAQDILNLILQNKKIKRCEIEIDKVKIFDNVDSVSITLWDCNK